MIEKSLIPSNLRVLHSAALLSPPSGICTQMDLEQKAANSLGIDWRVKMFCPTSSKGKFKTMYFDPRLDAKKLETRHGKLWAWFQLRHHYHEWLLEQQDSVDIFLLRYYVHDPFQYRFIKKSKKPVYFVHHTLEVPELALPGGIKGWLRSTLESWIGDPTISRASGIIGVTQEIIDYEVARARVPNKPQYVYPNGILFTEQDLVDRRSENTPEFLFVANFAPWHGLDRLLNAVAESDEEFVLHLVGRIPDELMSRLEDRRIVMHGVLSHREISLLSQQCWIGLASFALDRKNMKEACPLKAREYLMLGLPVYGDYHDVFPSDSPCFAFGNSNIKEIVHFSKKTRSYNKNYIARVAKPKIDKIALLDDLYEKLNTSSPTPTR